MEAKAIEINFTANRDYTSRLAAHAARPIRTRPSSCCGWRSPRPRFDADDIERIRDQMLSGLRRETTSPNEMASRRWWSTAFPAIPTAGRARHPGIGSGRSRRRSQGLHAGGCSPATRSRSPSSAISMLRPPASSSTRCSAACRPRAISPPSRWRGRRGSDSRSSIDLDVPQSVLMMRRRRHSRATTRISLRRFVVNHVLGGGSFSSRLYREVREVRGLAYSVYSTLIPLDHAALFMTRHRDPRRSRRADARGASQAEIRRLPTPARPRRSSPRRSRSSRVLRAALRHLRARSPRSSCRSSSTISASITSTSATAWSRP